MITKQEIKKIREDLPTLLEEGKLPECLHFILLVLSEHMGKINQHERLLESFEGHLKQVMQKANSQAVGRLEPVVEEALSTVAIQQLSTAEVATRAKLANYNKTSAAPKLAKLDRALQNTRDTRHATSVPEMIRLFEGNAGMSASSSNLREEDEVTKITAANATAVNPNADAAIGESTGSTPLERLLKEKEEAACSAAAPSTEAALPATPAQKRPPAETEGDTHAPSSADAAIGDGTVSTPQHRAEYPGQLHLSSSHGQLDIVEWLVLTGAEVEAKDDDGHTPLHVASHSGHLNVVTWLVHSAGAEAEAKSIRGTTPLTSALSAGHLDIVKWLVTMARADVETKGTHGETPLIVASIFGHLDIVMWLVNFASADVEAKSIRGDTALTHASSAGHLDIVKWLVTMARADVETKGTHSETPLLAASISGHLDIVMWLVSFAGADVEAKGNNGETPLFKASIFGHLDIVKWLVNSASAQVGAKDKLGQTLLHLASENGHLNVLSYLLSGPLASANVKVASTTGRSPLHIASSRGHLDVVAYLVIEVGADVGAFCHSGGTCLHYAAFAGQLEVVQYLLCRAGADICAKTEHGSTALTWAESSLEKYPTDTLKQTVHYLNTWDANTMAGLPVDGQFVD